MPHLRRPCGCRIHYSIRGPSDGTPVLLLAPGGMRSCIANWMGQPYDPWSRLPGVGGGSKYKVVAMDQRAGAGDSDHLPLPTSWATFRDDQLAVLDATAGDRKCLLVGSCIGPSFIVNLLRAAPERFSAAVLLQPIGLARHTSEPGEPWSGLNTFAAKHWFGDWASEQLRAGRAERATLSDLHESMFVRSPPFIFTASREEARELAHPLLILAGKDCFHPTEVSRDLAALAPRSRYVERWRDEDYSPHTPETIEAFLAEHSYG